MAATLNYGPYTDRYWKHPLYKVEKQFEVKRSGLFFDRDRSPYPVEIRVHRVELLRPLKLHYQVNGQGPFQIIPMRQTEPRKLRAEIPPQPWEAWFAISCPPGIHGSQAPEYASPQARTGASFIIV